MRIGQLALKFGANDFGSLMIEENVVAAAGTRFPNYRGRNSPHDRRGRLFPPTSRRFLPAHGVKCGKITEWPFVGCLGLCGCKDSVIASFIIHTSPFRDPRPRIDQALQRPAARANRGVGGDQFPRQGRADLRIVGAQRGGKDHGAANLEHDPQTTSGTATIDGYDVRHPVGPSAAAHRVHVGQHRRL